MMCANPKLLHYFKSYCKSSFSIQKTSLYVLVIWIFQFIFDFGWRRRETMQAPKCSIFHRLVTNKANFSSHVDCFQIALFLKRCGSRHFRPNAPPQKKRTVCKQGTRKMNFPLFVNMAKKNRFALMPFWKILWPNSPGT